MRWVGLLYSVVLTAERRVTKADLMDVAARAEVAGVATVLSTGNLIFEAEGDEAALERQLEAALDLQLGKPIPVFVRRADAWLALAAGNPFPEATVLDPARVAVRVMRSEPDADALARIRKATGPDDAFHAAGRALWLATRGALSTTPLLRAISSPWVGAGTFRNASAVAKIAAALS